MDSIRLWTYILTGATFALYIGIAFVTRARTTGGFYVAGHNVPPLFNGMATGADWMSAASFISMAGLISFMGYDGSIYLIGWTGGYVLLAMLLAPYLRKFGKYTVPDFVAERYYSHTARLVAVFCAIFVSFTYVAGQMQGVGIVFSRFLSVPFEVGVVIGVVIVFVYATLGGMRSITWTQVAQYCVLIVAFLIPAIAISFQLTGNPIPQLGFGSRLVEGPHGGEYLLSALDGIHRDLGLPEYTATFVEGKKTRLDIFAVALALMAGTAGLPHVIIRFYTVPSVRAARWSAFWALVFIGLLYTTAPAVASFARMNMIQSLNGKAYDDRPDWVRNWEQTGLIAFEDKNGDGLMSYWGDANPDNELTVHRDIMVLANPEIANLPPWVVGLVAAGGLAAALSTAAGLLLVISSSVSHDLIKGLFRPQMTEREELLAARVTAGFAVIVAGYFGIRPPAFVAEVVAFAFGLAASSFFPVIVLGIFSRRTTSQGAILGMLSGILFTGAYIIYFKFLNRGAGPDEWFLGISPEGIGMVGMIINFAVTIVVSRFTPMPPDSVRATVEAIRLPGERASGS
jgi:cation/acetate symporter